MNRILSGVDVPLRIDSWPPAAADGSRWEDFVGDIMVVLRPRVSSVGADGGGGRDDRIAEVGKTEARQRKHSPVP